MQGRAFLGDVSDDRGMAKWIMRVDVAEDGIERASASGRRVGREGRVRGFGVGMSVVGWLVLNRTRKEGGTSKAKRKCD